MTVYANAKESSADGMGNGAPQCWPDRCRVDASTTAGFKYQTVWRTRMYRGTKVARFSKLLFDKGLVERLRGERERAGKRSKLRAVTLTGGFDVSRGTQSTKGNNTSRGDPSQALLMEREMLALVVGYECEKENGRADKTRGGTKICPNQRLGGKEGAATYIQQESKERKCSNACVEWENE
jgi:hypothetical protein